MANNGTVLWDFDGTLGLRAASVHGVRGALWAPCLVEVLDAHEPDHDIDTETIRPHLRDGFPWHRPDEPHPHLCDPDAWWAHVNQFFARAFEAVGIDSVRARCLAVHVRPHYVNPSCWSLYPETLSVLQKLRSLGWRHVLLSNHVPELESIVTALGLADLVDATLTSALTGYEKPHPGAFEAARRVAGNPSDVWMVGDNPDSDVRGAEAVGIPAILVRGQRKDGIQHHAADLEGAATIIQNMDNRIQSRTSDGKDEAIAG